LGTKTGADSYAGLYQVPDKSQEVTMKRGLAAISLAMLLIAVPLAAEDNITGKWSGSFIITSSEGETKDEGVFMDLKQNGTELTGTAGGGPEKQWPILKGKVQGKKLTFEVETGKMLIKFELDLIDGHLKGEGKTEHEGRSMKAVVDMQRKTE
jgi:hypothetical protein